MTAGKVREIITEDKGGRQMQVLPRLKKGTAVAGRKNREKTQTKLGERPKTKQNQYYPKGERERERRNKILTGRIQR